MARRRELSRMPFLPILLAILATMFVARQLGSVEKATPRLLALREKEDRAFSPSFPSLSVMEDTSKLKPVLQTFSKLFSIIGGDDPAVPKSPAEQTLTMMKADEKAGPPSDRMGDLNPRQEKERKTRFEKYNHTYQYRPPAVETPKHPTLDCGDAPYFRQFFKLPSTERSRYDADKQIYHHFFQDKLGDGMVIGKGTYVELGAFDGKTESNSRFFDACLNWTGLLIEGNPTAFQKTMEARPKSHRMNFAPSCSADYEAANKTIPFASYPMTNAGLKGKARDYDEKPQVGVPCGPLGPVLEDIFEGERINFFSLDVEGAEVMVLKTIDFTRIHIDVLMVKVLNKFCEKDCAARDEIRDIMKNAGYKRYERIVIASDIYIRPDSDYVLEDYRLVG